MQNLYLDLMARYMIKETERFLTLHVGGATGEGSASSRLRDDVSFFWVGGRLRRLRPRPKGDAAAA